jgi:hypothetical protein
MNKTAYRFEGRLNKTFWYRKSHNNYMALAAVDSTIIVLNYLGYKELSYCCLTDTTTHHYE